MLIIALRELKLYIISIFFIGFFVNFLGLDFEINTYHKLLEGEEYRLQGVAPVVNRSGMTYSLKKVVEEYESAHKGGKNVS